MKYNNTNKTEKIKLTSNNYYVILDFDKTMTSKNSFDSWLAIIDFDIYGEKCKKEIEALNAKYSPIELDYTIELKKKEQYMIEWYQKSMDLLYQYQLTNSKLKQALQKNKLQLREGTKEFLEKLKQQKIPVIILSAGIGNVIEEFLKKEECYYDNLYIISNFIEFKDDNMQKFNQPIIHSMNKKVEGKLPTTLQETILQKQYTILCGDIIEDIQMISKQQLENTITIAFLNDKIEENLKFYQEKYDIVLTDEEATFQEVEKIIERKEEI
ncbi:MAG: hypothetical protein HFJ33_04680 [Clostridia bacterium]|nr:hypothetical protein [Clostridia bacterium]